MNANRWTSRISRTVGVVLLAITSACAATGGRDDQGGTAEAGSGTGEAGSVPSNPLRNAYFGETHIHTAYSLDAYIGGARLTPSDAYRFAKGEQVELGGQKHRISAPLDFAAITDHAEYLGEMYSTMVEGAPGHDQELLNELRGLETHVEREEWFLEYVVKSNRSATPQHPPFYAGPETTTSAWQVVLEAAEEHYEPGKFTTIPAFEWSCAWGGANLHRNVFFRDMNVPAAPMSYIDIKHEEELWEWMASLEGKGMQVIAVPHNSNASKGRMFPLTDSSGEPIDLEYAQMRSRFEPLVEMMQIKGNSEVHRNFWASDEFANFENADSIQDYSDRTFAKQDFVRSGLTKGLDVEQALGVNPFKYGIIGGTDTHNGTPGNVAEDNFALGSHGSADGSVEARRTGEVGGWIRGTDLNPGALAGVWATENTRGAIWDAMKAKETFATSGPRIRVRFFGSKEALVSPVDVQQMVEEGDAKGVPMGGTLGATDSAPSFTVWAVKDPDAANLDRIQIIKGWIDADGEPTDHVYDVAWSGDRRPDADGQLPAVANTVDTSTATYTNDIGAAELMGSWTDPEFDPAAGAVYYVRVLQIPTPRWSTYDAVRAGLPLPEDVSAAVQERAWSSPIWYTP